MHNNFSNNLTEFFFSATSKARATCLTRLKSPRDTRFLLGIAKGRVDLAQATPRGEILLKMVSLC